MLKRIAIVKNEIKGYSESFIDAHVSLLSFDKHILGDHRPPRKSMTTGEDFTGSNLNFFRKITRRLVQNLTGKSNLSLQRESIRNYLVKHNVQLVLAEYGNTAAEIVDICEALNMPLVVHFHGYDAYVKDLLVKYQKKYQQVFVVARALIVVSRDMERQLCKLGAPEEKVFYNVYGVDIEKFTQAKLLKSPAHFIAVGRFVDKKAPQLTILAFYKMLTLIKEDNVKLIMVGDGPLLEACKQITLALKIDKNVEFMGAKGHDEVARLMSQCRAFVQHSLMPSSGDSEGTPNSILEASASGLPVISTFHAGIKDVVKDNETGLLVDEGDIKKMAEAMAIMVNDIKLAAKMGKNGRELVKKNYSLNKSIKGLEEILKNAYK